MCCGGRAGLGVLASRGPGWLTVSAVAVLPAETGRVVGEGPAADGWGEDQVWSASRVAALTGRKFRVSCSVWGAVRLMHQLGFSPQGDRPAGCRAGRAGRALVEEGGLGGGQRRSGPPAGAVSASRTKPASPAGRPGDGPGAGAVTSWW
ncbi:winged helix-turn-helix domain-containing protein [Streptomyces sp. NPDC004787]|uniref:helix-turn-helix domain-containing protein n=1 Tax=Streptomyces sp. NPDC004787 TaxID=3154291 RepID=UPI0033B05A92